MILIEKNTEKEAKFVKTIRDEQWFNCSNENLLKELGRENDIIERVQFDDGDHIGSILYVYFIGKTSSDTILNRKRIELENKIEGMLRDFEKENNVHLIILHPPKYDSSKVCLSILKL